MRGTRDMQARRCRTLPLLPNDMSMADLQMCNSKFKTSPRLDHLMRKLALLAHNWSQGWPIAGEARHNHSSAKSQLANYPQPPLVLPRA